MSSRLKRNCKKCNKRANLAFDPKKLLCPDCLVEWRDMSSRSIGQVR